MDPNNHQKTLKINTQLVKCTPYVFVKRLTEEDIHVLTTKDSIKTEHMKRCLDLSYLKNKKKKDWNLMTNDKMENGSFRKPTVSSSKISGNEKFQKSNQTNVNQKKKSLANSTTPCLSSSSSKIVQKPKLNNMKMENETSYSHTMSSPSSSGLQSSKKSMKQKLSNVKLKNKSSTYLQFNGYSKNISKTHLSSEDLSCEIKVRDPKEIMELSMHPFKIDFQGGRITKHSIKNSTQNRNSNDEIDLELHHFTFLFDKYFGIPLQQTIVIMANIANASLLCENFYNEKKALFQRNIFNIEILQDHKFVLVSRLQKCVEVILLSINEYDVYNMALILFMCMLSIIPSLRVIHLDWNDTFKDLVQLFCNNLERSHPRFLKFINCIERHTFHSDCNNLIKLFNVAARLDCTMKSRMEIFFKPKNKLVDYFKRVNRAVRRNSNDMAFLLRLVDESSRNVCDSYKFKESQGIFLKNNPPAISKNTTNYENKKPTYLKRSNKNTTSKKYH